jgi:hypothetical protein
MPWKQTNGNAEFKKKNCGVHLNLLPTVLADVAPTAQSAVARVATACAKRMCILGKPTGRAWEAKPAELTITQRG